MITPPEYLKHCRMVLITHPIIQQYRILEAHADERKGYIRIRATLTNGDFLEMAEYFILEDTKIATKDYRFQWMNNDKTILRHRWDNAPHFPKLLGFPHHTHKQADSNVMPHSPMNFEKVLTKINALLHQAEV